MNIQLMWEQFLKGLQDFLPKLLGAVLILAVGWWLCNVIVGLMRRGMDRTKADTGIVTFLCSLTSAVLKIVVCITAASQLGMNVTSIIAALGAAGLAVGLALQNNMANIASGAQIIFTKPFRVGDYLKLESAEGTVTRIEIMFTTLTTADNKEVIIPNSKMITSVITNYSAQPTRRLDLSYTVSYDDDIAAAKALLRDLSENHPLALQEPAPLVAVGEHKENGIALSVQLWCKSEDYWTLYHDMQENVKAVFDEFGFTIPYHQLDVHEKTGKE